MLKNLPRDGMPMVGTITGKAASVALRTAFGDLPYIFLSTTGPNGLDANFGFPETPTVVGGPLPLREFEVVYLPVSRLS